ncbi:MAG: tetratricopeptide repeat protein [Myxococcota bacterium]|nr:tetratricopeptide repeat protein [Myxococcota bacterium]
MRVKKYVSLPVVIALCSIGFSASSALAATKAGKSVEEAEKAPAQFQVAVDSLEMDARADVKRDEAIAKLRKILPKVRGPQKAELLFRLAEKFWAKSRYQYLRAMQDLDEALDAWDDAGRKGREPKLETFAAYDQSELYKREALKLYDNILAKYPRYSRKDEVYYNLGSSLYDAGSKRQGIAMFWKLIKQFPRSPFAPDAWLQLGEHFFNSGAGKLNQAIKAYRAAAKTKKPRIFSFALYKLAWCDFNLGEYEKSLRKFRKVISYAKKQEARSDVSKGELGKRDRIQLMEEALADMVRAYSHLDAVDDAFEYYREEVGEEPAYAYLHRLSKLYNKEGKYDVEIKAYEKLNSLYPYAASAPENQTAIMNAYSNLGKNDRVRREVRRLIDLYSPNGTWAQKNAGNEAVLAKAFEVVETQLSGIVTEQHRAAQQTKLVETYKLARDIYKEYLEKFTDTANSKKFRFYYAEILFELKQFEEAAVQYDMVASIEGEYRKPASYTSVLAWEKVASGVKETLGKRITERKGVKSKGKLKELEKLKKLRKGQSYEPTELTEVEMKLATACDRFVEVAPKDKEVVKLKFKSARLYYIHNQFDKAAERFGEIIDRWPEDSLGRLAAELIVESFNVRSDWTQLNTWSRKFQANKRLMGDRTFRKKIGEFVEGASFNEILYVFEPKEGPKEIADRYVGFAKEFPKSKYVLVGLFNAVINYDKANVLERSIDEAERILADYKDFKFKKEDIEKSKREGAKLPDPKDIREKTLFLTASFYERLAEFDTSARLYEQYVREFKKGPKRSDAIFNAAVFRDGLGEFDEAIKNFKQYIKENPTKDDVPLLEWKIGLILERKKDHRAVEKHFAYYGRKYGKLNQERKLCANYKVVQSWIKQGKEREVARGYADLIKGYAALKSDEDKQKPCALDAVAEASFVTLDKEYKSYEAISLKVKTRDFDKNFKKKLSMIDSLTAKYTGVLAIGQGNFGIASLYRIGKMYQHLAKSLYELPCPRKLDDDQCGIYQSLLQEKAFPLDDKALEAFDKALLKAYELGLYNEWLTLTQEALVNYEPGRFPAVRTYDLIASEMVSEVPQLMEAN